MDNLIAICNNTWEFNKATKKLQMDFVRNKYLDEEEMEANFDGGQIKKHFTRLGLLATTKIVNIFFEDTYKLFKVKSFFDLDIVSFNV